MAKKRSVNFREYRSGVDVNHGEHVSGQEYCAPFYAQREPAPYELAHIRFIYDDDWRPEPHMYGPSEFDIF